MQASTNCIEYRKPVHEAFQSLAREYNVPLIPFFLEGVPGIESLNQRDGIHPNEEGTKIVVETVYHSLRPLLEKQGLCIERRRNAETLAKVYPTFRPELTRSDINNLKADPFFA